MLEAGENLLFLSEALCGTGAGDAERADFDGDFLPILAVDSICEVDGAHPAASDFAYKLGHGPRRRPEKLGSSRAMTGSGEDRQKGALAAYVRRVSV